MLFKTHTSIHEDIVDEEKIQDLKVSNFPEQKDTECVNPIDDDEIYQNTMVSDLKFDDDKNLKRKSKSKSETRTRTTRTSQSQEITPSIKELLKAILTQFVLSDKNEILIKKKIFLIFEFLQNPKDTKWNQVSLSDFNLVKDLLHTEMENVCL